jgi:hypothetical protein
MVMASVLAIAGFIGWLPAALLVDMLDIHDGRVPLIIAAFIFVIAPYVVGEAMRASALLALIRHPKRRP